MTRFIFFTKTSWREPPRLRHQLARLLASAGHEVIFFEKPRYFWQKKLALAPSEMGISFFHHEEIVHHKLRLITLLHQLNGYFVKNTILNAIEDLSITENDVVVNFNYDYFFLRDIFPSNRLITCINDDFTSSAIFGYDKPLLWALKRTCEESDHVLTVSEPLRRQLSKFCKPQYFFPWADCAYRKPVSDEKRNILLCWGYINRKIDFQFVLDLSDSLHEANSGVQMLFVGPVENSAHEVDLLRSRPNIQVRDAASLDSLPLEHVFAGFIPYRIDAPDINAIALPNKALQMLARGIPLLIRGMPTFLEAPFVFRVTETSCRQDISLFQRRFDNLQTSIEKFVSLNSAQARLDQFMQLVH